MFYFFKHEQLHVYFWDNIFRWEVLSYYRVLESAAGNTYQARIQVFFLGDWKPPLWLSAIFFCLLICPGPCNNLDPLLKFLYETPPSECTKPPLLNVRNSPFWILDPRLPIEYSSPKFATLFSPIQYCQWTNFLILFRDSVQSPKDLMLSILQLLNFSKYRNIFQVEETS